MTLEALARDCREDPSLEALGRLLPRDCGGESLFSKPFRVLHAVSDLYTARTALSLGFDLGWEQPLRRGASADELLAGFRPPSKVPAEWILRFLAEKDMLVREGSRYRLDGSPSLDLQELRALAAQEAPGCLQSLDLLDAVRSHIRPYFTEGRSGDACLFDLAVFPLWLEYFRNENILYRSNNQFALTALRDSLKPSFRILELGGGAGSFAQLLGSTCAGTGELGNIAEYRFTDIAPTFLRRAQRGLRDLAPGIPFSFGSLDINRSLDDQGLAGSSFDAIVGINVLHVAKRLGSTLPDLKRHLVPGGHLILGECLKPDLARPIYLEFIFQFMSSFTEVETDPDLRPTHGFLTPEAWIRILEAAGFRDVHDIPDVRAVMDRFPAFYVGAFSAAN
ncbi:MAG TPA: class I SAM-dependent methyltransferase [Holophaga sp.]|nr:class I SAM-dependent methyltransferase [Holophaga sp.]HPS66805.1 class I SAM-dependent methyltransferase [Holophaga sp.]